MKQGRDIETLFVSLMLEAYALSARRAMLRAERLVEEAMTERDRAKALLERAEELASSFVPGVTPCETEDEGEPDW